MATSADKDQFSIMIETRAVNEGCSHIDAIVAHCEQTGLEIEMVKSLINIQLKKKIEAEARNLRMIKGGKSTGLPI